MRRHQVLEYRVCQYRYFGNLIDHRGDATGLVPKLEATVVHVGAAKGRAEGVRMVELKCHWIRI